MLGPDGNTYEESYITHWLSKKSQSPLTRADMYISSLTQNTAVRNIAQLLNDCNVKELLQYAKKKSDTKQVIRTSKRSEKKRNRKLRSRCQRKRKKTRSKYRLAWATHKEYLETQGWLKDNSIRPFLAEKPSYSLMHSLFDYFDIIMYSRTHKMSYDECTHIHSHNRLRIRVATGMCILWNEALYHSGAKSLEGRTSMRFSPLYTHM